MGGWCHLTLISQRLTTTRLPPCMLLRPWPEWWNYDWPNPDRWQLSPLVRLGLLLCRLCQTVSHVILLPFSQPQPYNRGPISYKVSWTSRLAHLSSRYPDVVVLPLSSMAFNPCDCAFTHRATSQLLGREGLLLWHFHVNVDVGE